MPCAHRSRNSLWLAWGFPYVITQVNGIPYSQFLSLIQRRVTLVYCIELNQAATVNCDWILSSAAERYPPPPSLPASSLRRRINGRLLFPSLPEEVLNYCQWEVVTGCVG